MNSINATLVSPKDIFNEITIFLKECFDAKLTSEKTMAGLQAIFIKHFKNRTEFAIEQFKKGAYSEKETIKNEDDATLYEKIQLYKKLALLFHTDKIGNNQELCGYLNKLELSNDSLFQILKTVFDNSCNRDINNENIKEDLNEIFRDPVDQIKKMKARFNYFMFAENRYPQPLKLLAKIAQWIINILLILVFIPIGVSYLIAKGLINITSYFEKLIINLLTNNQYQIEKEKYRKNPIRLLKATDSYCRTNLIKLYNSVLAEIEKEFETAKKANNEEAVAKCEENIRIMIQALNKIPGQTTEEVKDEYILLRIKIQNQVNSKFGLPPEVVGAIDKNVDNEILSSINIDGLVHIKILLNSMKKSITKPLPEGVFNKIFAIAGKALKIIATPIFLSASIIIEASRLAAYYIFFGAIGLLVVAKIVSSLIISGPIFLKDGVELIIKKCNGKNNNSENTTTQTNENSQTSTPNNSPENMAKGLGATKTPSSTSNEKPGHFPSPIAPKNNIPRKPAISPTNSTTPVFG